MMDAQQGGPGAFAPNGAQSELQLDVARALFTKHAAIQIGLGVALLFTVWPAPWTYVLVVGTIVMAAIARNHAHSLQSLRSSATECCCRPLGAVENFRLSQYFIIPGAVFAAVVYIFLIARNDWLCSVCRIFAAISAVLLAALAGHGIKCYKVARRLVEACRCDAGVIAGSLPPPPVVIAQQLPAPGYPAAYGGAPQQNVYGAPQQNAYGAPIAYGAPVAYGTPPPQQSAYGAPPQQSAYGAPPQQNAYGAPPQQQNAYGAPPPTAGQQAQYGQYGLPPTAAPASNAYGANSAGYSADTGYATHPPPSASGPPTKPSA